MGAIKVGTCCYCGSKAALVLRGKTRHELSCNTCGAPLSRLKMLPKAVGAGAAPAAVPVRPTPKPAYEFEYRKSRKKPKKRKYRKGLARKLFEEVWDVVEDIFD